LASAPSPPASRRRPRALDAFRARRGATFVGRAASWCTSSAVAGKPRSRRPTSAPALTAEPAADIGTAPIHEHEVLAILVDTANSAATAEAGADIGTAPIAELEVLAVQRTTQTSTERTRI